jgi:hypothetical protein
LINISTNSIKYFIALVLIIFLYSGLIKWLNFGVDPTLISLILVVVTFIFKLKSKLRFITAEIKILITFGVLYSFTSIYTLSDSYYIEKVLYLWLAIFSFILPSIILIKKEDLKVFFKVLNLLLVITIIFLVYLFISGNWIMLISNRDDSENIPNYLSIGNFIVVYIIYNFNKVKKTNVIFYISAIIILLLLSGRGPVLGLIFVSFIYLIRNNKSKFKIVFKVLSVVFILFVILNSLGDSDELVNTANRFSGLLENENNERSNQFTQALTILGDNLFFGVGIGGYGVASVGLDELWHPHNIILEIMSESGIFISSLFIFFLFKIFIINTINIKLNDEGYIISLIALYLFIQSMKAGGIPDMRVTFFWFGLMSYCINKQKIESNYKN